MNTTRMELLLIQEPPGSDDLASRSQVDRCAPGYTFECEACEGSGAIPVGECGAYYRHGQTYDSPGMVVCTDCAGVGMLVGSDNAADHHAARDSDKEDPRSDEWREDARQERIRDEREEASLYRNGGFGTWGTR